MMKVNFSKKAEWRIDDTAVYIKAEFGRRAEQEFKGKSRTTASRLPTSGM